MDILRSELVEAQKARTDFIRWKLVFVATLGAVGLGLTTSTAVPNAALVLCCIPFVCIYVDAVCRHLSLRILVIGAFLRGNAGSDPLMAKYEAFVDRARHLGRDVDGYSTDAYALEDTLVSVSTLVINAVVAGYGMLQAEPWIAAAGLLGIVAAIGVDFAYRRRATAIGAIGRDTDGA